MCLDCNCGNPNDNHGNPDHITTDTIQRAAQASHTDAGTVAERIQKQIKK